MKRLAELEPTPASMGGALKPSRMTRLRSNEAEADEDKVGCLSSESVLPVSANS
jgi:hypothetical protein